jgi:hypothetical protein
MRSGCYSNVLSFSWSCTSAGFEGSNSLIGRHVFAIRHAFFRGGSPQDRTTCLAGLSSRWICHWLDSGAVVDSALTREAEDPVAVRKGAAWAEVAWVWIPAAVRVAPRWVVWVSAPG